MSLFGGFWNSLVRTADFWSDGTVKLEQHEHERDQRWSLRLSARQLENVASRMPALAACHNDQVACACEIQDAALVRFQVFNATGALSPEEFSHVPGCFESSSAFVEYERYLLWIMNPDSDIAHSEL